MDFIQRKRKPINIDDDYQPGGANILFNSIASSIERPPTRLGRPREIHKGKCLVI